MSTEIVIASGGAVASYLGFVAATTGSFPTNSHLRLKNSKTAHFIHCRNTSSEMDGKSFFMRR
jgi:hypothetical protein